MHNGRCDQNPLVPNAIFEMLLGDSALALKTLLSPNEAACTCAIVYSTGTSNYPPPLVCLYPKNK